MEKLVVVAFTHRNIYLNDLGKLVVAQENLSHKLAALKADPILGIEEVFYLATCNRVEFVFSAQRHFSRIDVELLLDLFYEQFSLSRDELPLRIVSRVAHVSGQDELTLELTQFCAENLKVLEPLVVLSFAEP